MSKLLKEARKSPVWVAFVSFMKDNGTDPEEHPDADWEYEWEVFRAGAEAQEEWTIANDINYKV